MKTNVLIEARTYLLGKGFRFADVVYLLCQAKEINQGDIATQAGISRQHLYMITSGKRPVNEAVRAAFKELLGLDPWDSE